MGFARQMVRNKQKQNKSQTFNIQDFANDIMTKVRASLGTELTNMQGEFGKLRKDFDIMKANVITVNELLKRKGLFDEQLYSSVYEEVFKSVIGVVDTENRMSGNVTISKYNFGG